MKLQCLKCGNNIESKELKEKKCPYCDNATFIVGWTYSRRENEKNKI